MTTKPSKRTVRRALFVALPLLLLAALTTAASADRGRPAQGAGIEGLRILLTNDDSVQAASSSGTDGKGMYELRRALCEAGADVVVIGPWGQQSGMSARVTVPSSAPVPLTVQPVTPPAPYDGDCAGATSGGGVYGVCQSEAPCVQGSPSASPSDAVFVGVLRFVPDNVWADGADLVVSGTNFGQNAGEAVNRSGTVGAAITAHELHQPAIAFSAEFDFTVCGRDFTCVPFEDTADFAVELIGELRAAGKLTAATALNVNYPLVGDGEQLGRPVWAAVGTSTNIPSAYEGTVGAGGGTYGVVVGTPAPETRADADTTALANNDIPITPLDGDWTDHHANALRGFLQSRF
jgi:5'-nucleotidase